jgi:hypothetical protein
MVANPALKKLQSASPPSDFVLRFGTTAGVVPPSRLLLFVKLARQSCTLAGSIRTCKVGYVHLFVILPSHHVVFLPQETRILATNSALRSPCIRGNQERQTKEGVIAASDTKLTM